MPATFRLTLAQFDPTLGDLAGNAARARAAWEAGRAAGADLVALPEMFLTGYQTQDLVLKPAFLRDVASVLGRLAAECADGPALGIGAPHREGGRVYNAWHVLQGGRPLAVIRKHHLPNDSVFDEKRVFRAGPIDGPSRIGPAVIGTPICEDAWHEDVAEALAESGAQILVVPNGSPHARARHDTRIAHMVARTVETGLPLAYLNLVGGQDDQVFDGTSFVLNPGGRMTHLLPGFVEALVHVDFDETPDGWRARAGELARLPDDLERAYHAMVLGTRAYLHKSGFRRALMGLSGGVDSALVAAIAADALGPANVQALMLPSRFTAGISETDAAAIAAALGIRLDSVPIEGPNAAVRAALAPLFAGLPEDVTEENIQSRLRGLLLMAVSNKTGAMLLTTGNKSEIAVGYATIYGDMNGGFNPIKDLWKTQVFAACRWRNANHRPWMQGPVGVVIPERVITRPPSAELRPDQTDQDSLPPYEVLDAILARLVEGEAAIADLLAEGYDRATVERVEHLLAISEWKRFQSAPGVRLTDRAFGPDRRYPIVNRWRDRG